MREGSSEKISVKLFIEKSTRNLRYNDGKMTEPEMPE